MITKGSFTFIMGPCLIEDHRHAMEHAHFLRGLADEYHVKIIYKSSFLKDNRTEAGGVKHITKRPTDGLEILHDVRKILPVVTDIHLANDAGVTPIFTWTSEGHINRVQSADMLQIPAMLSRQTSLLEAAGRTKFPILIKKGQWMDAKEFYAAARKVAGAGGIPILCERGNMSGGRYLYVDMELLSELISSPYPVVFDCTHSARSREHSINMAKAAVAMGVDGIFAEVHQKPDHAPSDGARMLNFDQARKLIEVCLASR